MATISTPKFGNLTFRFDSKGRDINSYKENKYGSQTISVNFNLNGKNYIFIPDNLVQSGWIDPKTNRQRYFGNLLVNDNIKKLTEDGQYVDLSGIGDYDQRFSNLGISTKGFLVPRQVGLTLASTDKIASYAIGANAPKIQGLSFINNQPVYATDPKPGDNGTWIQPKGTENYQYPGSNIVGEGTSNFHGYKVEKKGGLLGAVGDLLSSDLVKVAALGTGLYGLSTLASAGAAGAGAAGSGLIPGAAGVTGLTPGAAGITGITAPAGFALAPSVGAGLAGAAGASELLDLPSYGLLDTAQFPTEGIKATATTTGGAAAPFATTPAYSELTTVIPAGGGAATVPGLSVPGLSSMGGGTGLQVPVAGGTVTEMGFVPAGATPALGDPASFINNPDYLGSPVISEDYLALTGADMPSGLSVREALDAARLGSQLLSPQQQVQQGGLLAGGIGGGQTQPMGVDFSSLMGRTRVGLLPLAEQYRRSLL